MAAPDELFCWEGAWGLPSVSSDCLTVLAYAQFAGAPLKLRKISNPWRSPSGSLPALRTNQNETLSRPSDIIIHLRKQKFNADFDLSAKEGADSLAFISLLEERLRPALIYNSWVDSKNYVEVTRRWYAEHLPFPLNFLLPGRMQRQQLETLRLLRGDPHLEGGEELEKEVRTQGEGGGAGEGAVQRGCRVHGPALSEARSPQVLLWRLAFLSGRLCVCLPGSGPEGQAAQREAAAAPEVSGQPEQLLQQHPAAVLPPGHQREWGSEVILPAAARGRRLRSRAQQAQEAADVGAGGSGRHAELRPADRHPVHPAAATGGAGGPSRPADPWVPGRG
ncbi:metaxin-1-like isoform X1 [Eleginops maclovinus]|uniref:metaxin-1-like isoform X1 n=1 Tax=Eleginops maclovinus TaxID=56733 RepID=UPI0030804180